MKKLIVVQEGAGKELQRLAREEFKMRILQDVLVDMTICKIEGRDVAEYINEIKSMLDEIIEQHKVLKG